MKTEEKNVFRSITQVNSLSKINDVSNYSFKNLTEEEYKFYTYIGEPDKDIADFIEKNRFQIKEQTAQSYIIWFYNLFQNDYYYSLNGKNGDGFEGIKKFLLNTKKGDCSYYAYSYAYIMRYLGIPARVVGGFSLSQENKTMDFFKAMDFNAHAWVEIYSDDEGWITVDPTSSNIELKEQMDMNFNYNFNDNEEDYMEQLLKILNSLKGVEDQSKNSIEENIYNPDVAKQNLSTRIIIISIVVFIIILLILNRYFVLFLFTFIVLKSEFVIHIYYKVLVRHTFKNGKVTLEELKKTAESYNLQFDSFINNYYNLKFAPEKSGRLTYKSYKEFSNLRLTLIRKQLSLFLQSLLSFLK